MDLLPLPDSLGAAQKRTAILHLEQLKYRNLPTHKPDGEPGAIQGGLYFAMLKKWSEKNAGHIKKGVTNRAFGAKNPIDWENAFLPFMESMAVYLRDYSLLLKAVQVYREATEGPKADPDKVEEAIRLHAQSSSDIKAAAALWNMDFVQVCDLTQTPPEEEDDWDGPYCGAFYSRDPAAPFLGLAFKGTSPFNNREIQVDWNYEPIKAQNVLFDTEVSQGVYTGLFGHFPQYPNETAFQHIMDDVASLAPNVPNNNKQEVMLHVTGHSLGGSYSSFCFAQSLNLQVNDQLPAPASLGDLYTFGSPRVGLADWAQAVYDNAGNPKYLGQLWRIVNNIDLVPDVPPSTLKSTPPFFHIDNGFKIFKDKDPAALPTERGMNPPPPPFPLPHNIKEAIEVLLKGGDHLPWAYERAMERAMGDNPAED